MGLCAGVVVSDARVLNPPEELVGRAEGCKTSKREKGPPLPF